MDLSTIQTLDIYYANSDVFSIEHRFINYVSFEDMTIKYDLTRFPHQRYKTASRVEMNFSKHANDRDYLSSEETINPFERTIMLNDIVYFMVELQDGTKEKIYAPWDSNFRRNPYQSSILDKEKNLLIQIKKSDI